MPRLKTDSEIVDTADKWKQQDRADKAKHRDRVWTYFKHCFTFFVVAALAAVIAVSISWATGYADAKRAAAAVEVLEANEGAREADVKRKLEAGARKLEQERAWVACVNAIGLDTCTLVEERPGL